MLNGPTVLRSFRSDVLRDLARRALAQGWDAYLNGNGHVRMVSPSGAMVDMSTTAAASRRGHDQANVRAEFARAGLDLRPKAEIRRDRKAERRGLFAITPKEESSSMATSAPTAPPHKTAEGGFTFAPKGGRSVRAEDVDIDGRPFRIRYRADGRVEGTTLRRKQQRTFGPSADVESVMVQLRKFAEKVPNWTTEPQEPRPPHAKTAKPKAVKTGMNGHAPAVVAEALKDVPDDVEAGAIPDAFDRALTTPEPVKEPSQIAPADDLIRMGDYGVVHLSHADFPVAVGLAALHATVTPAIEALEAAGKMDAAALLRGELEVSPAEAELLRLWQEVHARGK